jgi:hypothetical protein
LAKRKPASAADRAGDDIGDEAIGIGVEAQRLHAQRILLRRAQHAAEAGASSMAAAARCRGQRAEQTKWKVSRFSSMRVPRPRCGAYMRVAVVAAIGGEQSSR